MAIIEKAFVERKPGPSAASSRGVFYLRAGVALVLGFLILRSVDLRETLETIAGANIGYLALVGGVALLDRYLMAYKWALLLRLRGTAISNAEAFQIYLASGLVGSVVPVGLSSDIFRLARTAKDCGKVDQVAASILVERAIGFLALVALAIVGLSLLVLNGQKQFWALYYATWSILIVLLAAFIIFGRFCTCRTVNSVFAMHQQVMLVKLVRNSLWECMALTRQPRDLMWVFVLSIFEQCIVVVMNFLGGKAVGVSINIIYFLAIIPVSSLVVSLPISINAIGVTEAVYVVLFSLAGVSAIQSLSLSLAMRAMAFVVLLPSLFVFLYDSGGFNRWPRHESGGEKRRPGRA